jgi:hypothetical protein
MKEIRQHEPLRIPQGWDGQDRAFVIQLERVLTDLYRIFGILDGTAVKNVAYDSETKNLTMTIDGQVSDIVKIATLDGDGKIPVSQLPSATQSSPGMMSAADKTKLDGIAAGATATSVAYDGTNKKITVTINGNTTDVVSVATIKSALGAFTHNQLAGL